MLSLYYFTVFICYFINSILLIFHFFQKPNSYKHNSITSVMTLSSEVGKIKEKYVKQVGAFQLLRTGGHMSMQDINTRHYI